MVVVTEGGWGAAVQQLLLENGFADRHEKKAVKGLNEYALKSIRDITACYRVFVLLVKNRLFKASSDTNCS